MLLVTRPDFRYSHQLLGVLLAALLATACDRQGSNAEAPSGAVKNDLYSIISGSTLRQAAPGVLANDDVADDAVVQLAAIPAYGSVELARDGGFVYEPSWRFKGQDSFSYQIVEGEKRSPQIWVHITHPNVVVVLVDDLGLGDVSLYNPRDDMDTPNMDALARAGVYFDQAHAPTAVCSPTRYSVLTGNYPYRSRLAAGIYDSYEPATMIFPEEQTLGDLFQEAGYQTGFVGKLHNGGAFWNVAGDNYSREHREIDFSRAFDRGPTQFGFEYSFVLPGGISGPPYAYFENDRLVRFDAKSATYQPFATAAAAQAAFTYVPNTWAGSLNGGRMGDRGWAMDNYDSRQSGTILTKKALAFMQRAANRNKTALAPEPFFLFFAPPQMHRPNLSPAFFDVNHLADDEPATSGIRVAGATASERTDSIRELDLMLGALLEGLEEDGQLDNTLVVFTSDNGPFPWPQFESMNIQGIDNGVPLRGYKGQIHEGGHRVPLIAAWGKTLQSQIALRPGTRSSALIGLQDLTATFYQLLGLQRPPRQANDSKSFLKLLTGTADTAPRDHLIVQGAPISANASKRIDRAYYNYDANGELWKLISLSSSTDPLSEVAFSELYNLSKDPGESKNLIDVASAEKRRERMQTDYLQLLSQPQTVISFE